MRSNLRQALLTARLGTAPRRRSLDLVWAALTPFEQAHLEREVDELADHGVRAAPLREYGPLFYTGPFEAVGPRVLAVCGAPEAGESGVRLAELAARSAAQAGATVLAGDTDGPESAAVAAALDAGGLAVSVLAEGFGRQAGTTRAAEDPAGATHPTPPRSRVRHVTASPCAPGQPWSVDAAMARNALIARLCTALVAVAAGGTGAVLDAGMRALAAGRPVLAVGSTAGSRLLVDYGATAAADELELAWWLTTRLGMRPRAEPAPVAVRADRLRNCGDGSRHAASSFADGRPAWHRTAHRWSTA